MKGFEQIASDSPHIQQTFIIEGVIVLIAAIVFAVLLVIKNRHTSAYSKKQKYIKVSMMLAGVIALAGIMASIHDGYQLTKNTYQGRFEIIKSNAESVNSKGENPTDNKERTIVLKDKQGNKQRVEVGDGLFKKGKYAEVTVQTSKGKPTLAKPINDNGFVLTHIEQVGAQTLKPVGNGYISTYYCIMLGGLLLIAILLLVVAKPDKNNKSLSDLVGVPKPVVEILVVLLASAVTAAVMNGILNPDIRHTYQGKFEIVKSDAEALNSQNTDKMKEIVLKDKYGNEQTVEVKNKNGVFKKGGEAKVEVESVDSQYRPTLTKPLDRTYYSLKHIEQVE